jgi:hypothetical protein
MLKEENTHPFHYTRVQALLSENYPRRVNFCEWILHMNAQDPIFIEKIMFIRNRIGICTFLTLYEGGKLTIPFYFYFPLLVSNRSLSALL